MSSSDELASGGGTGFFALLFFDDFLADLPNRLAAGVFLRALAKATSLSTFTQLPFLPRRAGAVPGTLAFFEDGVRFGVAALAVPPPAPAAAARASPLLLRRLRLRLRAMLTENTA